MPVIPALESQKQKDAENEASLSYIAKFCLNNNKNQAGLAAHTCNLGTQGVEMGSLLQIQGQLGCIESSRSASADLISKECETNSQRKEVSEGTSR